jgi:hypothetical protein
MVPGVQAPVWFEADRLKQPSQPKIALVRAGAAFTNGKLV